MEKPLCRLCKVRHWSSEPHQYPADRVVPLDKLGMMTARELMARDAVPGTAAVEAEKVRLRAEAGPDWSQCPHCAARRAKRAEVVRRNRAKKSATK